MCDRNCQNCACKTLYSEEMLKLMRDGIPAGSAAMIAYREVVETERDMDAESFLETIDENEIWLR